MDTPSPGGGCSREILAEVTAALSAVPSFRRILMRRLAPLFATVVLVLATLSACGGGSPDGSSSGPKNIDITISGDSVTPNGEKVEVGVGQKIQLHVTADAPGEIHVHSTPEQELEYDQGTTDLTLTIDKPGLVDVESHALEKTIVQLEVRWPPSPMPAA